MSEPDDGFLSRWSRRKVRARKGVEIDPPGVAAPPPAALPTAAPPVAVPTLPIDAATESKPPAPDPRPTLDDVAKLTHDSHFGRFVRADVDPAVRNAALKKLFADPQFNVMDGLDTYVDDYGKPDPLPAGMLRKMAQAKFLGLFDDEDEATAAAHDPAAGPAPAASKSEAPALDPLPHEDTDLRLQPHDAARCAGAQPGPGQDGGGER